MTIVVTEKGEKMARYIDADALKSFHGMGDDCFDCKTDTKACQYDYIYTKMDFCEWLDNAPTIDVVERKKGEWTNIGGIIRWGCPFCHHASEIKYNFCPYCGADMRGDEKTC